MLSLLLSTFVFFIASYYIKRYLDGMDIPKGITRSIVIFTLAVAIAYVTGAVVDWLAS